MYECTFDLPKNESDICMYLTTKKVKTNSDINDTANENNNNETIIFPDAQARVLLTYSTGLGPEASTQALI